MIVGNTPGFPSKANAERAERSGSTRIAAGERGDNTRVADDEERAVRARAKAEFSAFLATLLGKDSSLRADVLKQLPNGGEGLLDHLLAEGNSDADIAPDIAAVPAIEVPSLPAAIDAVRYGMIPDGSAPKRGIAGPAPAVPGTQSRITPAVLARIAQRRTAGVDELLASGDKDGALARATLDNLLSKAGTDEGLSLADSNAASAALTAALSASAVNVTAPLNDTAALDPELRARLARVVDRMRSEFGHEVTVVETARSQERQDYLYAQGRSAGGNIVTWTTNSAHTQGEAADVVVDGSWQNPAGFARLQQIAKEEGLRTLGARDPGHLELPKDAWTTNGSVSVVSATTSLPAVSPGIAQVAGLASVASVATTAGMATPAATTPALGQPLLNAAAGSVAGSNTGNQSNTAQSSSRDNGSNDSYRSTAQRERARSRDVQESAGQSTGAARPGTLNASLVYGETPAQPGHKFIGPVDNTDRTAGAPAADAAERVQSINALREQGGSKPLSQMTLEVEGPNGGTQQITVDVRGNVVETHISTDSATAERLRASVDDLKSGLANRGLQADTVRISTQAARANDAAEQAKLAGGERDGMRQSGAAAQSGASTGESQGQRDRSQAAHAWEERQASRDEQRAQQQRDAQRREASQQGRQGPRYQEKQ